MILKNFQYMKDIYFEAFEQFENDVDMARKKMLEVDYSAIDCPPHFIDLDTVEEIPDGRWNVEFEDVNFECFFHHKETKVLYVFLTGAISGKRVSVPRFARWSYHKFINGCMLNISDPMYRMFDKLKLGWYYGSAELNLHRILANLVIKVAEIIGVEQRNIVFIGSSGGGYSSIACTSYIPYAKSIAVNPQVVLREWSYSKTFMEITNIDLTCDDKWHRNNAIYYLQHNKNNMYILFVNLRSKSDMEQVRNICDALNIHVRYGLNVFDNLIIWLYDADMSPWVSYHDVQENYCIWFMLEFIIEQYDKKEKLIQYRFLFDLVNELYYEWKRSEKKWRGRIPDIEYLWKCEHTNREVVIFGLGEYAEFLNRTLFCIEKRNYYQIRYVIDNDINKTGTYHNLQIRHPSEIKDWTNLYIIITSEKYQDEISQQLIRRGLEYKKDFITYKDLYQ